MNPKLVNTITDAIIDELVAIRKNQGLSHESVATLTGLHRSTISLIESKKRSPTLKSCILISDALGKKFSDIARIVENRNLI